MSRVGLSADVMDGEDGIVIALTGAVDEHSAPDRIVPRTAPHVLFDLNGIERVTSYGVIHWLAAMKLLDGRQYAFARCRPTMIRQFNMIAGFGRTGKILSVYLPYFCGACRDEYEQLLDLTANFAPVLNRAPPLSHCPKCAKLGEFDEAPETYFGFGADYGERRLTSTFTKLLALVGSRLSANGSTADSDSERLRAMRHDLNATAERLAKFRGGRSQ